MGHSHTYVEHGDSGDVLQKADLDVIDDGPGKPIQIWNVIGRRPILAAGSSDGDLEMLAFAGGSSWPALRLLVVHDDADREVAYGAGAKRRLAAAHTRDWTAISMKDGWRQIFPGSARTVSA